MKKVLIFFGLILGLLVSAQVTTNPSPVLPNSAATINFDKSGTGLASYTGTIYAHIGVTVNGAKWQNVIGSWGNNTTQPALTLVSGTTYKLDITPNLYTYFGVPTTSTITELCIVFRSADGSQKNGNDIFVPVGAFQVNLVSPLENSTTLLNANSSLAVSANNSNGNSTYVLKANGATINTQSGISSYSYTIPAITTNTNYELEVTNGTDVITKRFSVIINNSPAYGVMPAGMKDGINYNASDPTQATLVLNAPGKNYVYVAGSFNNYAPNANYAMMKDPSNNKFWITLTGLTSGQVETYQYWVVDTTPSTGSPALVKTADPFSPLVLSPYDDPYILPSVYPNLPAYPVGQEREVTVLQTGMPAYAWQISNFIKPAKEKLVIYELLVRDFSDTRDFQALIDNINYFKDLKINAIELMPVMEFEGNDSWGYNPAYHMALDKAYGTQDKFKEFIDICHQNGISVILDIALNHVTGRSPLVRMWMNDPDGDGWGGPAADSPYMNVTAKHTYSVGEDINHSTAISREYVKRVIQNWITEYKIDGFRWDLTKGFTQNCNTVDQGCTNAYQQDRVDVLKLYADYQWAVDPSSYVIFEHLGTDVEEQQWANYKTGIMTWGNMNHAYAQNSEGYNANSDFNRVGSNTRGFNGQTLVGYAESHDEERLMFNNLQYGNSSGAYNVKTLATALERMKAIGSVLFTVPGPKMLWQFGDLGYDYSINHCLNGTINNNCRTEKKPIRWDYYNEASRKAIYDVWAKIIAMKTQLPIFNSTSYSVESNNGNLMPKIYIWDNNLPSTALKNVIVVANFTLTPQYITPNYPYTGNWYNLMDNSVVPVTSITNNIYLQPGEFRILGNQPSTLSTDDITPFEDRIYVEAAQNPVQNKQAIIDYYTPNSNNSTLQIFSNDGSLVYTQKLMDSAGRLNIQLNVPTGVYQVIITSEKDRDNTQIIVK